MRNPPLEIRISQTIRRKSGDMHLAGDVADAVRAAFLSVLGFVVFGDAEPTSPRITYVQNGRGYTWYFDLDCCFIDTSGTEAIVTLVLDLLDIYVGGSKEDEDKHLFTSRLLSACRTANNVDIRYIQQCLHDLDTRISDSSHRYEHMFNLEAIGLRQEGLLDQGGLWTGGRVLPGPEVELLPPLAAGSNDQIVNASPRKSRPQQLGKDDDLRRLLDEKSKSRLIPAVLVRLNLIGEESLFRVRDLGVTTLKKINLEKESQKDYERNYLRYQQKWGWLKLNRITNAYTWIFDLNNK